MTICSKLINQPLFTKEGVLAKNVTGTKDASSVYFVHGSKKNDFCKIHKIKNYSKCSNSDCKKPAIHTSHIRIDGDDETVYLTPLCGTCNNYNNRSWFELEEDSRIVELIYVSTDFPERPTFDTDLDKRIRICT